MIPLSFYHCALSICFLRVFWLFLCFCTKVRFCKYLYSPAGYYFIKVSNRNTSAMWESLQSNDVDVVLLSLLLTLNWFYLLFWYLYFWLLASKCRLGRLSMIHGENSHFYSLKPYYYFLLENGSKILKSLILSHVTFPCKSYVKKFWFSNYISKWNCLIKLQVPFEAQQFQEETDASILLLKWNIYLPILEMMWMRE